MPAGAPRARRAKTRWVVTRLSWLRSPYYTCIMSQAVPLVEELTSGVCRVPGITLEQLRTALVLLGEAGTIQAEEAAGRNSFRRC